MADAFTKIEKELIAGQILLQKCGRILEEARGFNEESKLRLIELIDKFHLEVQA